MHSIPLYLPRDRLSLAELSAARIDGVLTEVGEAFVFADTPDSAHQRARSLSSIAPAGFVLCGPSAAWVHGAGDAAPLRHHVQSAAGHRPRLPGDIQARHHDVSAPAEAQVNLGGVLATTAVRTLQDLLLGRLRNRDYDDWVAKLAAVHPELIPDARASLRERQRVPGKAAALELLDRLQDEVTR